MMHALPSERYEVDPLLARALEVVMIVHMDHEQNASTSTVRTAGPTCRKTPRILGIGGRPPKFPTALRQAGCLAAL